MSGRQASAAEAVLPVPEIDIAVECEGWWSIPDLETRIIAAIEAAALMADIAFRPGAEVSVLLTDDEQVRELNRTWRRQDKPTNVLSFPAAGLDGLAEAMMLGDIVLAHGTLVREAAADDKALADHLAHLTVHGFLHLLGFDHVDEAEAARMEALERRILATLGVADPYANNS